jgi:hypothetical protein
MNSKNGGGKGYQKKELQGPGKMPLQSALIGGVGNGSSKSAKKAGKVGSFCEGGKVGGFRNAGMVNRR